MKNILFLFMLFLTLLPLNGQDGYEIEQLTFIPREYYVGDIVDLRIAARVAPGITLSVPDIWPDSSWLHIHDLSFLESDEQTIIHITFTSFQPGIRMLPLLDLGDMVLDGIRVDTASILEEEYFNFVPAADPLYLPKTAFYFALLVGILLGIPLLLVFFLKGLRRRIRVAVLSSRRKRPYLRIQKMVRELERKILNRDGNLFYTVLMKELKLYMSLRTGIDFLTLTSREIGRILNELYPEEFFKGTLGELFKFSDQVKFGGEDPFTARKKEDISRLNEAVNAMEIYYKNIWATADREGGSDVDN